MIKFIKVIKFFISIFIAVVCFSCNNNTIADDDINQQDIKNYKENIIKANKYLVKQDKEKIEKYIKDCGLDMIATKNGLWYSIIKKGNGAKINSNSKVAIKYIVSLLDSTICYTSDSLGIKQIKIGQGNIEPGMNLGLQLLSEGDSAQFILQPFMAHGLTGDYKKIPPRAIIVYNVKVLKVE